jgi:glycogen debranching enzyme
MKDKEFVARWADMPAKTKESFISKFWLEEGYLADYVNDYEVNDFRRSNMIVACALDYKMLDEAQVMDVLSVVRQHLITPRGVRSLSPRNPFYQPSYGDDQRSQDLASRNGSIWIWPLMLYVKSCFAIAGERFLPEAEDILNNFNEEIQTACIGSISECFEGDPPFHARGCLSQATSVGGLLHIKMQIEEWSKAKKSAKTAKASKSVAKKVKGADAAVSAEAEVAPKAKKSTKKSAEGAADVAEQPKKKCVRKKK